MCGKTFQRCDRIPVPAGLKSTKMPTPAWHQQRLTRPRSDFTQFSVWHPAPSLTGWTHKGQRKGSENLSWADEAYFSRCLKASNCCDYVCCSLSASITARTPGLNRKVNKERHAHLLDSSSSCRVHASWHIGAAASWLKGYLLDSGRCGM